MFTQIRYVGRMINAGAHRFAAPAAVVQLRRQTVGIGDSHRRHTARSRSGAVGVAVSPIGAAARGSLKRAESIVGARQVNLADQVAVTAAVGPSASSFDIGPRRRPRVPARSR